MRRIMLLLLVLLVMVSARAERFDEFLDSLPSRFPIDTSFMKVVLNAHKTRLARPSILENWGLINSEAAATYNGVLNVITLKDDYIVEYTDSSGKKRQRVKTVPELERGEPIVWSLRADTIFHELSHAEYSWLPRSKDLEDIQLIKYLNTEFDNYLKKKQPQYNGAERMIARSEMFAYFRGEYISRMNSAIEEILLENGYFRSSRSCKNTLFFMNQIKSVPRSEWNQFLTFGIDQDYTQTVLPVVFVKGKEAIVDNKDVVSVELKNLLWRQLYKHFSVARSKSEVVRWMNSKPQWRELISPCRQALIKDWN